MNTEVVAVISIKCVPSGWRFDFLAMKFHGFLRVPAKVCHLLLPIFETICNIIQDSGESSGKFLDFLSRKPGISKFLAREPRKFLDFSTRKVLKLLRIFDKILATYVRKVRKNLQDFSKSWKKLQEKSWSSWQQKQEQPTNQSNTTSENLRLSAKI